MNKTVGRVGTLLNGNKYLFNGILHANSAFLVNIILNNQIKLD